MKHKLGIYMGSFNPVHNGHAEIVNYLLNNKYVDDVLIVPTLNYWNKQDLLDINHRINMLKYLENNNIKVDSKNNRYIYTYELMQVLSREYETSELYLIIGADNIVKFNEWKNVNDLLKYSIIVLNRDNIDIMHYIDKHGFKRDKFIVVSDYPYINISSSAIRNDIDGHQGYLCDKVYKYIKKNNLYGGK